MSESSAQSIREKFEFYFLALTFTLLGASIQTANFSASPEISIVIELTAWVLLGASGLLGLSKVQWISSILLAKNQEKNLTGIAQNFRISEKQGLLFVLNLDSGKQVHIAEMIEKVEGSAARYRQLAEAFGRKNAIKHHFQWWFFILGLMGVGAARGYAALC